MFGPVGWVLWGSGGCGVRLGWHLGGWCGCGSGSGCGHGRVLGRDGVQALVLLRQGCLRGRLLLLGPPPLPGFLLTAVFGLGGCGSGVGWAGVLWAGVGLAWSGLGVGGLVVSAWGVLGVLLAGVGGVLVIGAFWVEGWVCVLGVWRGSSIAVVAMALTMFFRFGHRGLEAGWGPWPE